MPKQLSSHILMVRPAEFAYNTTTAKSNAFQDSKEAYTPNAITHAKALHEFDEMVNMLVEQGIEVSIVNDESDPQKPDAVFPNNWVSFHENGKVVLYPLFAENRRPERRMDIIETLKKKFVVDEIIDLSSAEKENKFLESTGSMVFDRPNQVVYACYSNRTHPDLLKEFAQKFEVEVISFHASDPEGMAIYHSNVMMNVADDFAVICDESIKDEKERNLVLNKLTKTGKDVITINAKQMKSFAGNMLAVENQEGKKFLVMSEQAFKSLGSLQIEALEKHATLLHCPLETIESNGGGSARCMMAEVFLEKIK